MLIKRMGLQALMQEVADETAKASGGTAKPEGDPATAAKAEDSKAKPAAKATAAKESDPKKDAAAKAAKEAMAATRAAERAAADAKEKQEAAAALAADAAGLVVVNSPRRFGIHVDSTNGTVYIERGISNVKREIAEHPYAQAHGCKIIGLPVR